MILRWAGGLGLVAVICLMWLEAEHIRESEIARYQKYNGIIEESAAANKLDSCLIKAVIWQESRYNERAFGTAQERGLMQVTPIAGSEWAATMKIETFQPTDLFDPRTNIQAGSWYLARAIRRWNQADIPEAFALAEYNAGRSQALRWASGLDKWNASVFLTRIDYPSTRRYVENILKYRESYRHGNPPENDLTLYQALSRRFSPFFHPTKFHEPVPGKV